MGHIEHLQNTNDLKLKIAHYTEIGIPDSHITVITRDSVRDYLKSRPDIKEVIVHNGETITDSFQDHDDNPFKRMSSYSIDEYERTLADGGMLLYIDDAEILRHSHDVDAADDHTLELHKEVLEVDKKEINRGEIVVNKETHTELESFDVPIKKDKVTVERRPVEGEPLFETYNTMEDTDDGLDVIRIPITRERIKIIKEKIVTEEIVIRKETVENVEHVSGTVRYEDVTVSERLNKDYEK
ncbi:YsnF/AvaK domain-containing protein [Phocicoccus pinnipedialis]|uniref:Stress response protein YsnF n=1 Tax=Phocicoccus pinnipedialis TaxID=110845 RepID=A0A6V7RP00_9BACL|nr:YsnF/AvaK domain-containing protein [Jeotgalicoccus pinnipedialis]MBP1938823.1 uncharacterized protein (TIGR02271 family) [Jeotgalicoccus pinnipedialis]CAD2079301.1 Stress response protein YsnF [Jeotgalicoccus pinnipedialis]